MPTEIRRYHPDHKSQVVDLMARTWWKTGAAAQRVFEWKFERNPYLQEPLGCVATAEGKVIGFRGVMGTRWKHGANGQSTVMPCAENLVVEPDYRNLGIAQELNLATLEALSSEGYHHVINLTANPTNFHLSIMSGWRSTPRIEQMTWSPNTKESKAPKPGPARVAPGPASFAKRVRNRIKFSGATQVVWQALHVINKRRLIRRGSPELVVSDSARPSAMAELVARLPHDHRITHVRDEEYFRWRFEARPPEARTHNRFLFWGRSPIRGYLVLSWKSQPSSVKIADVVAEDEHIFAQLVQAAQLSRFVRLETWTGTLGSGEREAMLRQEFRVFSSSRFMPAVLVRPTTEANGDDSWRLGELDVLDLSSWHLSPICVMGN